MTGSPTDIAGRRVDAAGAVRLLADAGSVVIVGHVQPDADTVDAGLASGIALCAREFDVARVAARFGGRGHRLAAGYTAEGSADDVAAALIAALG